jgi:hypothetical protein
MIPLVIERYKGCKLPELPKPNMLVESSLTVLQLSLIVINKLKIKGKESLFFSVDSGGKKRTLAQDENFREIYDSFKDEDQLLYLLYHGNETFGG